MYCEPFIWDARSIRMSIFNFLVRSETLMLLRSLQVELSASETGFCPMDLQGSPAHMLPCSCCSSAGHWDTSFPTSGGHLRVKPQMRAVWFREPRVLAWTGIFYIELRQHHRNATELAVSLSFPSSSLFIPPPHPSLPLFIKKKTIG